MENTLSTLLLEKQEVVSPPRTLNRLHLDYLDGLRAVTALYVVLHHAFREVDAKTGVLAKILTFPFRSGHNAVGVFIVLSGFCLMLPVARNSGVLKGGAGLFIAKRAKRILPTYYLAMLFSLILIRFLIDDNTTTYWKGVGPATNWDITSHLLLIHNLFYETSRKINYCFWSIAVEWDIYFLFPLLVISWKKLGAYTSTIMATLGALVLGAILIRTGFKLNFEAISIDYIALFALGMLAAHISFSGDSAVQKIRDFKYLPHLTVVLFLSTFVVDRFKHVFSVIESPFYSSGLVIINFTTGIFACILLIAIANNRLPISGRILSSRPLVFIGTFAYSIYLIHAPLIEVFVRYFVQPLHLNPIASIAAITIIGIPFIIITSYLFYLLAEKPFLNTKKGSA